MMVRVIQLLILLLVPSLIGLVGCRTSLNADEFIANTLSGRSGEIRGALLPELPIAERTEIAQYLAAIEPLAAEAARLAEEADGLQTSSRSTNTALSDRYGQLADQVQELGIALGGLRPPAPLIDAHGSVVEAYRQQATVAAAFAKAFAKLDMSQLRQLSVDQATASREIAAAHARLSKDAGALFQPGTVFTLPPDAMAPQPSK